MIRWFAIALASGLLGAVAMPSPARAGPALPDLTAGSDTVHVGDVFTIPISVANVAGLTSFQFDLAFNLAVIKALSFTDSGSDFEAAATAGGGSLTGITGFIDNGTGLLSGIADSISGPGTGLTPSGVIVDIEFQALAVGISPGHPFQGIQNDSYWTATTDEAVIVPTNLLAYIVRFGAPSAASGRIDEALKTDTHFFWCVRGGASVSNPPD